MNQNRATRLRRITVVAVASVALAFGATTVSAAKPTDKPATTLKLNAVLSGASATINYQVNVPASAVRIQTCAVRYPNGLVYDLACDTTPESGSGKKLTKYSVGVSTFQVGDYTVEVGMILVDGRALYASIGFTVIGPAVRLEVTGLVPQEDICYIGIDCFGFPGPTYPHQIATVRALDSAGHVATGYTGTVSFENPISHYTPPGLSNMQLTNGVGYVPVQVPNLGLGYYDEPFTSNCPSGPLGNGRVLAATDTVDPSIFGCQNIGGGGRAIVFPDGFFDAVSDECPTGCLAEPTGNLTIDTNVAPLFSPNLLLTQADPLIIQGATVANLYFTQPIDIGPIYFEGTSLPLGTLDPCALCTSTMNFLAAEEGSIVVRGGVDLAGSVISMEVCFPVTAPMFAWSPPDDCQFTEGNFVTVKTTVEDADIPSCYLESSLSTFVNLEECN